MNTNQTVPGESKLSSERLAWVDVARLIAIFLVMQAHCILHCRENATMQSCAVALFFLLAGFFDTKSDCMRRLKRVAIFSIACAFWLLVAYVFNHAELPSAEEFVSLSFWCSPGHLWFLEYLVIAILLNGVFLVLPDLARVVVIFLLVVISTRIGVHFCVNFRAPYIPLFYSLLMYFVGVCLAMYAGKQNAVRFLFGAKPWGQNLSFVLGLCIFVTYFIIANTKVAVPYNPLYYLCGCWAILAMAQGCCRLFPAFSAAIAKIGPATYLVYIIHPFLLRILLKPFWYVNRHGYLSSVLKTEYEEYLYMCVCSFVGLIVIIILSYAVYRKFLNRWHISNVLLFGKW